MSQIICRDVRLGYDGVTVCENLNFSRDKGDYLCVVGDNGSGKSTLVKTLLGLRQPLGGQIIRESDLGSIGYLPQKSESRQDFPATVREVVLSGCSGNLGKSFFYTRKQRELAVESMSTMHISKLADRSYSRLSGGQQQRVLLARALCAAKKIILLDEPVSGLDPAASAEMYDVISHMNYHGMTVIMVTHDIEAAVKHAKKILYLGERPEFFTSVEDYVRSDVFPLGGDANE